MPCKEIKGKANNLRDKGANKIYKLFGFAACAALLLAGCDVTDPIYDSVGEVTLTTAWTNTYLTEAPAAGYTVAVGDQSAIITQNPASVENLFQPGTYTGYVYTAADKITVSGTGENTVATVTGAATPAGASGTFIAPDPAFFYSGSKEVTIEKNEEHDITVAMRQDVRELTFIIRPDGDAKVKVESINSAMNGIAGVWNLHTNTACGEAFNIAPVFTKNGDGDWTATVYMLGITGTEQKLSGSITFTTESNLPPITFEKDLRTATGFPAFNSEKKKPLALEAHLVSVHNQLELGDFTAIPDWTGNEEEVGGEVVIILDAGEELVDKVNDAVRQLPQVKIRGTKAMDADDFEELKDNFPNLAHLDISGTATTEIPTSAFHNKTSLHAIILPEGMKVVGNSAFRNSGLESIEIPASVGSVGIYAFYNCSSLKEATLVQGLEAIENNAFQNSGLESIAIPATVTTFGDSAFRDCSDLTEATLAEGLKVIGKYAFSNSGLESIAVPASVTTFGLSAFNGCTSLKSATLEDGLKVIGEYAFSNSGLISIEIPTSVENFGSYAFYYCSSLESATLADGLTVIGQSAFRNSGLTSIAIPASVRSELSKIMRSGVAAI